MDVYQGRTAVFGCTLRLNGVAVAPDVITGNIKLVVKWNTSDPDDLTLLTCSYGDGVVVSGGTGVFTVTIAASKTSSLPLTPERIPMVYELFYITGANVYTLDSGSFYVLPTVQRTV